LTIRWPEEVSAMAPVPVEVEVLPPPGINVTTTLSAFVREPGGRRYWEADLLPQGGNLFVGAEPLRLPLVPPAGDWRLTVLVESGLEVRGERVLYFQPASIAFYDLGADPAVHTGFGLWVPQAFQQTTTVGDAWAGGRVWRYQDSELSLYWAPGPVEPLVLNTAIVMLEASHDAEAAPRLDDVQDREWQGQIGFLFQERWPEPGGGPGEALVVQGPDYWLYVLRLRAVGQPAIPALLREVAATFTFVEP
jgi:hypothetical protein